MRFEVVEMQLSCHSVGFHVLSCHLAFCQAGLSEWKRLDSLPLHSSTGEVGLVGCIPAIAKLTREQARQGRVYFSEE
jgi:hypothetical protein